MPESPVMAWLAAGLPITLLVDLADPDGPDSPVINATERPTPDPMWDEALVALRARAAARRTA